MQLGLGLWIDSSAAANGPVNTVPPSITGDPVVGETLTCVPGTWTGSPTITRQWNSDGTPIGGETGLTYAVAAGVLGTEITVTETADGGPVSATSAGVGPVVAPANTVPPSITGTAEIGETLTCVPGTWTNSPTITRTWNRNGVAIGGATGLEYVPVDADFGAVITVTEIANGGVATATSAGTDVVAQTSVSAWWDPSVAAYSDSGTTPCANDDPVYRLPDVRASVTAPATQTTLGNRPTYKTNILNGLPVLRCDGTDDFMTFTELSLGSFTLTFVALAPSSGILSPILGTPGLDAYLAGFFPSGGTVNTVVGGAQGSSTVTYTPSEWGVWTLVRSGTSLTIYLNGVQFGDAVTVGANATAFSWFLAINVYLFIGDVGPVYLRTVASNSTERAVPEDFFMTKFGITP